MNMVKKISSICACIEKGVILTQFCIENGVRWSKTV
jgi:hypothetical protein